MNRTTRRAGTVALLSGLLALAIPPHPFAERVTWEGLLAPYSTGAPLPGGFRVEEIRRGPDNGIVVSVRRSDDGAAVEVLVVERGRWQSAHRSPSFTIDYELPRSPAAEREAVTALLADTIRARDHGLPAPDALPLRADDGGVLPWALEMLRGTRGMLLGATVTLLALLVLLGARELAYAGIALAVVDVAARFAGMPPSRLDVGAGWMVPAAAGLLLVASWGRRVGTSPVSWPAAAVAAIAILLRVALGPWGPLHVNGHGARFVAGAVSNPADIAAYGPGYHETFAPIAALAPSSPDWAIFGINAILAGLLPPLAFAIGRMTGLTARAAFVAALLLAIDPVAIRMGATEAYLAPIAFLCTAASVLALVSLREMEAGGRWRVAALLVAAGALLGQAARIHPSAWVLMATVPSVILAGDVGTGRRRIGMALALGAVSGGILLFTSSNVLLDVLGNIRTGIVFRPPPPSLPPLGAVALAAIVYGILSPRPRLALPAGIAVAAACLTRHAFDASWIWEQSYFRLYLTLPVVAVLACVPPDWLYRRWLLGSAAAMLGVGWLVFGWPVVAGRTTDHLEYRWVREQLARLPPECRVIHLAFAGNRVVTLPTYAGSVRPAVAMDARRRSTIDDALAPAPCLYYVHTSLCSTVDGRPECEAIERRLTLAPIARTSFAAAPEPETFGHDSAILETTIARVEAFDR